MRYTFLLIILCCLSCHNERILHLPEIENAEVTTVLDVSPAYIFYDETQPDSTLLNRKNLIITTNWLVNVDKRLTLRQAIPHIKILQDKKRNAELHKNEDAKNYYTCNDTSIKNLGFLDFTDVNYITDLDSFENSESLDSKLKSVLIHFITSEFVSVTEFGNNSQKEENIIKIDSFLTSQYIYKYKKSNIQLVFHKELSFQKYISIKHKLKKNINETSEINNDEFIY